jgi:hypothetical protein
MQTKNNQMFAALSTAERCTFSVSVCGRDFISVGVPRALFEREFLEYVFLLKH